PGPGSAARAPPPAGPVAPRAAPPGEIVGLEDLAEAPRGALVPPARRAVARHDHAVPVAEGEYGGAVGHARRSRALLPAEILGLGQEMRCGLPQEISKARRSVVEERLLPARIRRQGDTSPAGLPRSRSRSPAVGDPAKSWRTCASVPRRGSSMKIFFRGPSLRSKITESQEAETTSSEYFCRHIPRK